LNGAQKVACVGAAKEMSKILQESERNDFDGIAIGDESWFQHITASSKIFGRSAADVIPRARQAVGGNKIMIMVFFTDKTIIVLDALPRSSTCNQLYFISNIFLDFKTANLNFRRQKTVSTFWVHMGNCMYHNGSKITSKVKKNQICRMPHPLVHQT
jgi:hypothetical protein